MDRNSLSFEEEQAKWNRLKELAGGRKLPVMEIFFSWELKDKDGNVIKQHRGYSHSTTRNFWNLYIDCLCEIKHQGGYSDGNTSYRTKAGPLLTSRQYIGNDDPEGTKGYSGTLSDDGQGICIGTDNTAESVDDYVMGTLINDGSGAGEMEYQSSGFIRNWDGGSTKFTRSVYREFQNSSGGSITVEEVGIYWESALSTSYIFLMLRDLISGGQAVGDGESLLVQYDFELTYP